MTNLDGRQLQPLPWGLLYDQAVVSFEPPSAIQAPRATGVSLPHMAWTSRQYTKGEINRAGSLLAGGEGRDPQEADHALVVLNNWRSCHSFPLNTFQTGLRRRARAIDSGVLVAQRLKRVSSIVYKLQQRPGMQLARMQDIAGCRAILDSAEHVAELRTSFLHSSLKHKLINQKNYIAEPKESGYRGVHLVYRYYSDKKADFNDLQIEVQLRSRVQHAWATAVETVGTFLGQSLKSSEGSEAWLEFFKLASDGFAFAEGTATESYRGLSRKTVSVELRRAAKNLDVVRKLEAYGAALEYTAEVAPTNAHYFLLRLDLTSRRLQVTPFTRAQLPVATEMYLLAEKDLLSRSGQAVLVSADSLAALRRSYPNYFLDTDMFLIQLESLLK